MAKSSNARRLQPCMPPLLEEETKPLSEKSSSTNFAGSACEKVVEAYFLSNGINVAVLTVDDGTDIVIEKPEGFVRGQVKKVVYQLKLDSGMKARGSGEVYRSRFNFNFQGGASRKQKGPESFDYFYHVLLTPYRQLIWETPVNIIPLREDGTFVFGKNPCLDRDSWVRKKADINYNELLIFSKYDPIVFQTYPDFFLKKQTVSVNQFLEEDEEEDCN